MTGPATVVRCQGCDNTLDENPSQLPRLPCPACGSKARNFSVTIHETLPRPRESIRARIKRQGRGKPFIEHRGGEDLHRKSGKWYLKERVIDEERDYYRETITDPDTGEIIHHEEHRLSEHKWHGSAKRKKPSRD